MHDIDYYCTEVLVTNWIRGKNFACAHPAFFKPGLSMSASMHVLEECAIEALQTTKPGTVLLIGDELGGSARYLGNILPERTFKLLLQNHLVTEIARNLLRDEGLLERCAPFSGPWDDPKSYRVVDKPIFIISFGDILCHVAAENILSILHDRIDKEGSIMLAGPLLKRQAHSDQEAKILDEWANSDDHLRLRSAADWNESFSASGFRVDSFLDLSSFPSASFPQTIRGLLLRLRPGKDNPEAVRQAVRTDFLRVKLEKSGVAAWGVYKLSVS